MDTVLKAVLTDTGGARVNQPVNQTVKVEVVIGSMVTVTVVVITSTGGRRVLYHVHNTVTVVCVTKYMDIVTLVVHKDDTEINAKTPVT